MKGYIQVYTGNGKGKTTAAIGLSVRAAGAGLNVFIAQFMKMGEYSEIKSLKKFSDRITIKQFGLGKFMKGAPSEEDMEAAQKGFHAVRTALLSGKYDIIILEEGNVAAAIGLLSTADIIDLLNRKPDNVEIVITGRNASQEVMDKADLVTEMKDIKHYYNKGVAARTGIEK
jgi:cob(I)alamin adenosyltransferase